MARPSCIYLRKSRADIEAEQQGAFETLARHKAALLALAKSEGIIIGEIYEEIVSGDSLAERPQIQRLLKDVSAERWENVLVMDIDRLARGDTIDQGIIAQTFQYSNTKIVTPQKVYNPNNEFDEEYFEYGLFMARREYKAIKRRLQRGREASVREGKYVGSRPPYGYDRIKLENAKGYTLKINDEEATVVRLIFELYTSGVVNANGTKERIGVSKIVRYLNDLNIRPKRRETWSPASIRDILINPVYIGKVRWNWRPVKKKMENASKRSARPRNDLSSCIIADGLHKPIVSVETWELAQHYMKENPARPVQIKNTVANPLSGLLVCGKCGRKMVRRPYGGNRPDFIICPYTDCNNVSSALTVVEERLLSSIRAWATEYRLKWKQEAKNKDTSEAVVSSAINQLKKSLSQNEKKIDKIYDLLEQGVYSHEEFLTRSKKALENSADIKQQIETLENELKKSQRLSESYNILLPKLDHLLETYSELTDAESKNDLLKEVLEKVVYTKEKRITRASHGDSFSLVLYPKIPK